MSTTPRIGITEIEHGEINGDVTINEMLRFLDFHMQAFVEHLAPVTVPGSPTNGQAWIIDTPANWPAADALGNAPTLYDIAHRYKGAWYYYTPADGWVIFDKNTDAQYHYNASAWAAL